MRHSYFSREAGIRDDYTGIGFRGDFFGLRHSYFAHFDDDVDDTESKRRPVSLISRLV